MSLARWARRLLPKAILAELKVNLRDAVRCQLHGRGEPPQVMRLHFVDRGSLCAVRLPRDLSGDDFAKALERLGYRFEHRESSHQRYCTQRDGYFCTIQTMIPCAPEH